MYSVPIPRRSSTMRADDAMARGEGALPEIVVVFAAHHGNQPYLSGERDAVAVSILRAPVPARRCVDSSHGLRRRPRMRRNKRIE
jgi:hypothetical protein